MEHICAALNMHVHPARPLILSKVKTTRKLLPRMSSKTVALLFLAVLMLSFVEVKCYHGSTPAGKRSQVTAADTPYY